MHVNTRTASIAAIAIATAMVAAAVTAQASNPNYSIAVTNGEASVGEATAIQVTITIGDGFKANDQYPNKVSKLSAGDAVELGAKTVPGQAAGTTLTFSVPVKPLAKGDHAVSGQIRFSYCNDTSCHLEKVALDARVTGR